MIEAKDLCKKFEDFLALDHVSCHIEKGCIYGMVGSNGAGKSTFLRVLAGIYQRDGGQLQIDGEEVWENPEIKGRMIFVPDELYFLPGATIPRMIKLYAAIYPRFDRSRAQTLSEVFKLPLRKPIDTFSKGMKRQAATLLALSARPDYLLLDETFDGLDAVMRNFVKGLICNDVAEYQATAILTSHSLRELEDTCDQLVLLHRGGVILENDVQNLKTTLFKVQIAFEQEYDKTMFADLDILDYTKRGSVANMILRGDPEDTRRQLSAKNPILCDMLPLTLEEVFTFEMQALGYDFREVLEGMEHE